MPRSRVTQSEPNDRPRRAPWRLPALAVAAAMTFAAACEQEAPSFPELAQSSWKSEPLASPGPLEPRLEKHPPEAGPTLGGPVHQVWAEAERLLVVLSDGTVRVLEERDGALVATPMGKLEVTCLPLDIAVDGRGHACAQVPCGYGAMCWDGSAWKQNPTLKDPDVRGLASGPGAIVTWRRIGTGSRTTTEGRTVPDERLPGYELLASTDGGQSWGRLRTITKGRAMVGLGLQGPKDGTCAYGAAGERITLATECLAGGGQATFVSAGPSEASWVRTLLSNGAALTATSHADAVVLHPALPEDSIGTTHRVPIEEPVGPLAAWSEHEILLATASRLYLVDLQQGRFRSWSDAWRLERSAEAAEDAEGRQEAAADDDAAAAAPAIEGDDGAEEPEPLVPAGLGRVGTHLVVVGRDGRTVVR